VLQIEIETDNLSNESFEVDESRSDSEKCVDDLALADYVATVRQLVGVTHADQVGNDAIARPLYPDGEMGNPQPC
jgi:hypothetical protein